MYPGAFARVDPERVAAVMADSGEQLTYRELEDRSRRLSRLLYDAGLRRGDVVALLIDNSLPAFEVYWAALRSGLYLTDVNSHLTADEATYIINDCGARVLVVSAGLGDLAATVARACAGVELRMAYGGDVEGCESYEPRLAEGDEQADVPVLLGGGARACGTPRPPPAGPRACGRRCRSSAWTRSTIRSPSSPTCSSASTPSPSCTCPPRRCTTRPRCAGAAPFTRSAAPWCCWTVSTPRRRWRRSSGPR